MALPPVLNSIVSWLRAGYPYGVPDNDYVALLALLARRLTAEEVAAVAAELGRQSGASTNGHSAAPAPSPNGESAVGVDNSDIGVLITKITNELPREEDIERVRSHLEAAGPFL